MTLLSHSCTLAEKFLLMEVKYRNRSIIRRYVDILSDAGFKAVYRGSLSATKASGSTSDAPGLTIQLLSSKYSATGRTDSSDGVSSMPQRYMTPGPEKATDNCTTSLRYFSSVSSKAAQKLPTGPIRYGGTDSYLNILSEKKYLSMYPMKLFFVYLSTSCPHILWCLGIANKICSALGFCVYLSSYTCPGGKR